MPQGPRVERAAVLRMAAARQAVRLERGRQPPGLLAAASLVRVQHQLAGLPVVERVRRGRRPRRDRHRRLPEPELESRQRSPAAGKSLERARLRPERRPRRGRAVRKRPEPVSRQDGNLPPAVQANRGREGPPSRANGAGAPKRPGQRVVPGGRFAFPPAQCPRRGYSQVPALFLAYYCGWPRFFLSTTVWKGRAFLEPTE